MKTTEKIAPFSHPAKTKGRYKSEKEALTSKRDMLLAVLKDTDLTKLVL
jgi:hypothetical protein